jgi:hypothetical protein
MHLDVRRTLVGTSLHRILHRNGRGLLLLAVAALIAPNTAGAHAGDAPSEQRSASVAEPQAPVVSTGATAPIDLPASRPPEPPIEDADLLVELTTNGDVLLRSAASASKATSAITSTVQVEAGNVRLMPTTDSAIIGAVHADDVLEVLGVSDDWYLVRLGQHTASDSAITGEVGWVSHILIDTPRSSPTLAASSASAYRWLAANNTRVIYDEGGVLHLRVTDEQARSAVSSSVMGRASDLAPAKEISFTLTLHWAKGHAPGGSIFHTMLGDGRDLQMRVGPGEGYPWVDFALDDQTLDGSGTGFPLYTPTPVQFTWNGSEVVATVGGEERARVAVDSPMTALRIAIEADPGCVFHLSVGDMTVTATE